MPTALEQWAQTPLRVAMQNAIQVRPAAKDADARFLNPVGLEPFVVRSLAESAAGDLAVARASLVEAVDLRPDDPEAWLELGVFELDVVGDPEAAIPPLRRGAQLDRFGPAADFLERAQRS